MSALPITSAAFLRRKCGHPFVCPGRLTQPQSYLGIGMGGHFVNENAPDQVTRVIIEPIRRTCMKSQRSVTRTAE